MSTFRIASRYAQSILELAEERKCLDEVQSDMQLALKLCKTHREFLLLLKNPIISHYKKLTILKEIFKGKVSDLTLSGFELITRKRREMYLPEIAQAFINNYHALKGIVEASVTTVKPLNEDTRQSMKEIVKNITHSKVILHEHTAPPFDWRVCAQSRRQAIGLQCEQQTECFELTTHWALKNLCKPSSNKS